MKSSNIKIPESLKRASKEKKDAYVKYVEVQRLMDTHNDRFYHYIDPAEEVQKTLDLKSFPYVWHKRHYNLPKDELKRLEEIHKTVFKPMMEEGRQLKKVWSSSGNQMVALNKEIEARIIELCGRWHNQSDIRKMIAEEFGLRLKLNKISEIKQKNDADIKEIRYNKSNDISDIHLTHKRSRIEELCYIASTQKIKYKEKDYSILHAKEMRACIEQIRKEIEGDRIAVDLNGNIDINTSINMNMNVRSLMAKVNINSVVISLVAAKRGVDPMKIMSALTSSYYRDFNGFNKTIDRGGEPKYPSELISTYDWGSIERMHKGKKTESVEIIEETPTEKQEKIKKSLVELMKERQKIIKK